MIPMTTEMMMYHLINVTQMGVLFLFKDCCVLADVDFVVVVLVALLEFIFCNFLNKLDSSGLAENSLSVSPVVLLSLTLSNRA